MYGDVITADIISFQLDYYSIHTFHDSSFAANTCNGSSAYSYVSHYLGIIIDVPVGSKTNDIYFAICVRDEATWFISEVRRW